MTGKLQIKLLLSIMLATAIGVGSDSIVTSKDSLWIYNNSRTARWSDTVVIQNNGSRGVSLDSARLRVTEWDTLSFRKRIAGAEVRMSELHDGAKKSIYCILDSADADEYRLDFPAGGSSGDSLLTIGPYGDSTLLYNLQIGYCFTCDLEKYPRYLTGSLRLHFSNGEVIIIRLYSDDLRSIATRNIRPVGHPEIVGSNHPGRYLINGRVVAGKTESYIRGRGVHRLVDGK